MSIVVAIVAGIVGLIAMLFGAHEHGRRKGSGQTKPTGPSPAVVKHEQDSAAQIVKRKQDEQAVLAKIQVDTQTAIATPPKTKRFGLAEADTAAKEAMRESELDRERFGR